MRFRDRFKLALYRMPTPSGDVFVDSQGVPVNLGAASGGGSGDAGGGGTVLDSVDLVAATEHTFMGLTAERFAVILDGTLESDTPPAPAGLVSYAVRTDASYSPGPYIMLINRKADGLLAHQAMPGGTWASATREEFEAYYAAHSVPGQPDVWSVNSQSTAKMGDYIVVETPQASSGPGNIGFSGVSRVSAFSENALTVLNDVLDDYGFPTWPSLQEPKSVVLDRPVNVKLLPNGSADGTEAVIGAVDGSASLSSKLQNEGLVVARAVTGPGWRTLSRADISAALGVPRVLVGVGTSIAPGDASKRTYTLGGTAEDDGVALTSFDLDFDGTEFTGKVTITA